MRKFFTLQFLFNVIQPGKKETEVLNVYNGFYKAPERCVENILNFARAYKVAESETTGKVEMILN
ncbi:MAG: hypothetical protein JW798_03675 [Prolixibacteraceae bacterium]|nr:hypothetical protein [Prolixibacteraceae bacterium]